MRTEEIIARMKDENLHCGELMKRINDELEKTGNCLMQKSGITVAQFKMLVVLYMTDGGAAALKELERFFEVAQSTAAGIAARLERKHYVESYGTETDRRVKYLRITSEGRAVCQEARKGMQLNERRLLGGLDPEEREQFRGLLQKIYDYIKTDAGEDLPPLCGRNMMQERDDTIC